MSSDIRVRFAPSPTGYLHIGGARTALFNWLHAKHTGGTFVLRIEDTDRSRNTEEAARAIYDGLRWLGLDWDEGPEAGGNFGPYFQSEREEIYRAYLEKLRAAGRVYDDEGAVRFRFEREKVTVDDTICGQVEFDLSDAETNPDMTIRRADGSWIFHFVNVVDDIEMKISDVIRGEDHLSNTPKHIQLYRAFGAAPPRFAHIPLILNLDGSKMSKRDQGASLITYIENGYLPEAVRNFLCLLGWSPKDDREKLDIAEVVKIFDLAKVHRKNAAFDLEKCTWLNGEYLRELSDERFQEMGRRALARAGIDLSKFSPAYIHAALDTCKGKFRIFNELPAYGGFYFRDELEFNPEGVAKHFVAENKPRLEAVRAAFAGLENFDASNLETTMKATAASFGVKVGALVHPTRLAVTGSNAGPSLYHLLEILGKEKVLARLDRALSLF
ncbi:MAG TPA: glutamate--tRNA ligase [Chthoniobacterales bacterium]|jgi:glutamyl-tRNA synthetase|nr:glutamate--tRNA ligase [Chthoniobacterales bacterium]